jgi:type IV pilus assembly protein PilW
MSMLHQRSRPHQSAHTRARGFTLVELMVAMTIGLIILAGVAQIFTSSRTTYVVQEGLARVQENGRFAMEFIAQDLRMAGYAGCVNINQALNPDTGFSANNHLNGTDPATNFVPNEHMQGYDYDTGSWDPVLPAGFFVAGEVQPNTDVVLVRRGSDNPIGVTPPYMPTPAGALHMAPGNGLSLNDIVIVSDCENADIFQITGPDDPDVDGIINHNTGGTSPGNATKDLSKMYDGSAEVIALITRVYYIGTGANGAPALFRKDMQGGSMPATGQELVQDVETMQILYGEDTDTDGNADIYRLPVAVTDWSRVVSVRIGLLVRSPDEHGGDANTNTYTVVPGGVFGPVNDRRQRRLFASTIQLRNQRTD